MPNSKIPQNTTEFVQALHASLDEEDYGLREASDVEVDDELEKVGIESNAALARLHSVLEQVRSKSSTSSTSPLELLYQRCRASMVGVTGSLRDDVLGIVRQLSPEHVSQAAAYASEIDPQNQESLKQFRKNLSSLAEKTDQGEH